MFRKFLIIFLAILASIFTSTNTYASRNCLSLGPSDYGTFKEYCYKITDSYMDLRNSYEVNGKIDIYLAAKVFKYAKSGLEYLPDSLSNKNYFNHLKTSIERGMKDPSDVSLFADIKDSVSDFLTKTTIKEISGNISVSPKSGNAPLTVTLRGNVKDPTGTKLENLNYTWRVNSNGTRKVIGNNVFLRYTFSEEGNYSVFLDVTSNHRNSKGNIDVLTFSKKAEIEVKEKIASTIIRVNSKSLGNNDEIKFSPVEASYGLLIDATSSTPTSGTKFKKTKWDFGNGVKRKYSGQPRIERVVYSSNGVYEVKLEMTTNTGKKVEREFYIVIREPIATINAAKTEGYLGDNFSFVAEPSYKDDNLNYNWEIIDLTKDKVIFNGSSAAFNYSFTNKGRYNVKLEVTSPSGEKDYDSEVIYINSRAPVADFTSSIPYPNKPNIVFLDGSKSYDLDFSDEGKLKYNWLIDGDRVKLDNPNKNGSNGYYTFSSIGDHNVVLEVVDPDDINSQKSKKVTINSLLSLDFHIFPRVSQIGSNVKFIADSPNAVFYEWDFGDGEVTGGSKETITHSYKKSGIYKVTLKVGDSNDKENTFSKKIYIADSDSPYAMISIKNSGEDFGYSKGSCDGKDAYLVNRIDNVIFSAVDSIDVDGKNSGLEYSWKIGRNFYNKSQISKKFDELGCIKVKLTVRSKETKKSSTTETYVKVENKKPSLSNLNIELENAESDPVIVNVTAVGAKDEDGVIQSYLWYYYTDVTSDPQGFKITKSNKTKFVLPKVTGTYYFVVKLKDNNEEIVNSEEISSRYFINLLGDNANTPIISLKVNNSSITLGESVTFTATAEDVQGFPISKNSTFYWDFDGDGFYDKQTNSNSVTHKYQISGEIRPKVKVLHKGYSNTRSITINVLNSLKPDFSYLSIGNKYIFFNNTKGFVSKYIWDMGDGSDLLEKKDSFVYEYKDGKATHLVKLKVEDGTKIKDISKEVTRSVKNLISTRKSNLEVFSNYKIKDGEIILDEKIDNLYFYLASNLKNISNYVIDYDISLDSDINGGNDDDRDNKNKNSFYSGDPIKLELNNLKEQVCRVYLISESGNVLASKDIKVIKNYLKDKVIGKDSINLNLLPSNVVDDFEKLLNIVYDFPKKERLKAIEYVKKLIESWEDDREKTSIILEFEGFINESDLKGGNELVNLLESLIVESEEDKSEKAITLKALKNLIPKNIICDSNLSKEIEASGTCYDLLVLKLDNIAESSDLEKNKLLGKEILTTIALETTKMSSNDKLSFKAILKSLINNGLENISKEEIDEIIGEQKQEKIEDKQDDDIKTEDNENIEDTPKSGGGFLKGFLLLILFILGLFIFIFIGFFVFYKLKNKDKNKSFIEFVSELTYNKKPKDEIIDSMIEQIEDSDKKEEKKDPLSDFSVSEENKVENKVEKIEEKPEENITSNNNGVGVPDWLKGGLTIEEKKETKQEESKINNSPDSEETKKEEKKEEIKEEKKTEEKEKSQKNEVINKENEKILSGGAGVPDWLKGSLENSDEKPKEDKITKEKGLNTLDLKEEQNKTKKPSIKDIKIKKDDEIKIKEEKDLNKITKLELDEEDENLPDWLKGSLTEETKSKEKPIKPKKEKIEEAPKEVEKVSKKTKVKKEEKSEKIKPAKEKKTNKKTKDDELWDDGMKVPDWLKTDDDK